LGQERVELINIGSNPTLVSLKRFWMDQRGVIILAAYKRPVFYYYY